MKTVAEINARIAVLDREIAGALHWGAAITARNEERAGLLREWTLCEIAKPVEIGKALASGGVVDSAAWTGAGDNAKKSESWPTKPVPTLARALLTLREWLDNGDFPRCSEDVKITIDIPEAKQTADILYRIMRETNRSNGDFFVLNKSHRYVGANLMVRYVPPAPKPLAVGDMTDRGTILAIDGDSAWVKNAVAGSKGTFSLAGLKRAAS